MNVFDDLKKENLKLLFRCGIAVGCKDAERLYLNGQGIQTSIDKRNEIWLKAKDFYRKKLVENTKTKLYTVVTFENTIEDIDSSDIELLSDFNLTLKNALDIAKFYDDDNEQYKFLFLFMLTTSAVDYLLKGKLNRHFGDTPYHMCEIFIMNPSLSGIVNAYDDRGIDYLPLTK